MTNILRAIDNNTSFRSAWWVLAARSTNVHLKVHSNINWEHTNLVAIKEQTKRQRHMNLLHVTVKTQMKECQSVYWKAKMYSTQKRRSFPWTYQLVRLEPVSALPWESQLIWARKILCERRERLETVTCADFVNYILHPSHLKDWFPGTTVVGFSKNLKGPVRFYLATFTSLLRYK